MAKQLWGQKAMGISCPWVTPVTVGRAHLGGRWLTVRHLPGAEARPLSGRAARSRWVTLTAPGSQVPHAIPVSSRPRALGRGALGRGAPAPSLLPAAADPTEVLWAARGRCAGGGRRAWRQARLLGEEPHLLEGRGCTCWGLHLLRWGSTCFGGGPHLLEGGAAPAGGLQPPH